MTTTDPDPRAIVYTDLDDLPPAARNAKAHNLEAIKTSMREWGFTTPVLVDERTGRLVAGHGRTAALREVRDRGGDPPDGVRVEDDRWLVPVVRGWASDSDMHAEAYVIADNRLTEIGGWDERILAEMLEDVAADSLGLLEATGYTGDDLDALLASVQGAEGLGGGDREVEGDPDEAPAVEETPALSRPGDVWELGVHRLIVGDATSREDLARLMGGEKADAMWTDPPYGCSPFQILEISR